MKSITIEKIPEGDAAREGPRNHLRAGGGGSEPCERGKGAKKGSEGRERTLESGGSPPAS